jgi:chromosome segregation ATPase
MPNESADETAPEGSLKLLADLLRLVADLIAVMADAPRADKAIKQYAAEKEKADRAKTSLADARARHDEQIAASTAELAKATAEVTALRSAVAKREQALVQREEALTEREANFRDRERTFKVRSREIEELPGGMTRETPPSAPERGDPHYSA